MTGPDRNPAGRPASKTRPAVRAPAGSGAAPNGTRSRIWWGALPLLLVGLLLVGVEAGFLTWPGRGARLGPGTATGPEPGAGGGGPGLVSAPDAPRPTRGPKDAAHPPQPASMPATGKRAGQVPNDWFHIQRAWPGTEIDAPARALAVEQARALREAAARSGGEGAAGAGGRGAWEEAGPVNIGGRITAIAVHPSAAQRIFVGAADGGVFRSLDGGTTWQPVFDDIGSLSIGALAVDPSDPAVVYCGTGEANAAGDTFAGIGLFRSTDAGTSWSSAGLERSRHINRIAIDPADPARLYAAVMGGLFSTGPDRGLYRSTDGGASWERRLFLSDSTGAIDVVVDPADPRRVYAAMWERLRSPKHRRGGGITSGVWRSTDGGETWGRLAGGLPGPAPNVGRIGLALCAAQPQTLYAIYADDIGWFSGLYKSVNGGDAWTRVNDGALEDLYSSFGWYFGNVRVDPGNPSRVFALGLDIYRSTNGGNGWGMTSSGVHVDQHDLWIDPAQPSRMLAGGDGGLYRTTNGGSSWTHVETLPITQFYAGAIDHLDPRRLYGGTQDNGTVRTWTGGLDDWSMIYGGDGFYTLVDPRNSNIIFAEYQYGNLARSTNGGSSFYSCLNGVPSGDRRNWSTPVVFDPANPDRMYYGTYRLFRSTNGSASWSAISPDLTGGTQGATLVYATLTTIAVAPGNGEVIYVGTDDARVWRTTDGGAHWTDRSAGLPDRWVTRVAIDPVDPDIAYVAQSGYRSDDPAARLHRTTDGGATWTGIAAGLPEAPVNALVIDPAAPNLLYAGTDVGVFVSPDAGGSWSELAPGLPVSVIQDLVLHAPTRALVAFTHGRSTYRLELPDPAGIAEQVGGQPGGRSAGGAERGRVLRWLELSPNPYRPGAGQLRLACGYDGAGGDALSAGIYDAAGRLRRTLEPAGPPSGRSGLAGERGRAPDGAALARVEFRFDGRGADGRPLPAGTYYARISRGRGAVSRTVVILP